MDVWLLDKLSFIALTLFYLLVIVSSLNEIDKYQTNPNMQKIIPMIKEMKTYQKVMIHQLSHGKTSTMPEFIQKEVEGSMLLLAKLEAEVETLKKSIGMM